MRGANMLSREMCPLYCTLHKTDQTADVSKKKHRPALVVVEVLKAVSITLALREQLADVDCDGQGCSPEEDLWQRLWWGQQRE
jgi:hypothetical protein